MLFSISDVNPRMVSAATLAVSISCDVLAIEDLEGLLQRFDFFFAPSDSVLVAHAGIHARWLQLVEVSQSRIEFLLCALHVLLLHGQGLRLVLLLCGLVLDVC